MSERSYWQRARQGISRRRFVAVSAVGGGAAFLAACGGDDKKESATPAAGAATTASGAATQAAEAQVQRGNVTRTIIPNVFDSVDVHRAFGDPTSWMSNQILSKLVWYSNPDTGEVEPDLSEKFEVTDAANYTFNLRKGAKWHNKPPANGREVVAEDIKWHFERQATGKLKDGADAAMRFAVDYKTITKIETPDKYTVKVTLNGPNGTFIDRLANYFSTVPNREATEAHEADHRTLTENAMIGTGPYVLTSWRSGQELRWKKNPDYFRKDMPITDGHIAPVLFEDPNAYRAAFEQKQLDAYSNTADPSATRAVLAANKGAMYESLTGVGNTVFLSLNMNRQFKDVRHVQAINMAIDRRLLIQTFHQGLGQVSGPVTWLQEGFAIPPDDLIKEPGYRTDRELEKREARALWQASGGPALGEIDIKVPDTWLASWPDTTQFLPKMLNDNLGVTQFKSTKTSYNEEIIPNLANGNFPNWFGWTSQVTGPDPRAGLRGTFLSTSGTNFNKVNNPQIDALVLDVIQGTDRQAAVSKVRQIQKILVDNAQYGNVVLYNYISPTIYWNYYKANLKARPTGDKPGTGYNIFAGHLAGTKLWIDSKDASFQGRPPASV